MEILKSTGLLFGGILKRFYWLIPSLSSDPFDISERWFRVTYEAPWWMFWVLLFCGFTVASILTHHELRREKVTLEGKLNDKKGRKVILDFLAERRDAVFPLYHQAVESKDEFDKWSENTQEWVTNTQHEINAKLMPIDASIFRDVSGGMSYNYPGAFNKDHNSELNLLTRLLENLDKIIQRYPTV